MAGGEEQADSPGRLAPAASDRLEDWMTRFGPSVLHFAYSRLRHVQEAQDVFQEVFVRAHLEGEALRDPDRIRAWLLSVTANLCRDRSRSRLRRPEHTAGAGLPDIPDTTGDPAQRAIERARDENLWRKVLALAPDQRDVIVLYYFEDLGVGPIAEILGVSREVVKTRLHRARARLRQLLPEEG